MTKNQVNRKEMQDAVITYLDSNTGKISSIPVVMESKNQLAGINQQIESGQAQQQEAKVYVGKSKAQLKKTIAEKTDILNDIVETHAVVTGNAELESKMSSSASDFMKLRNEDFVVQVDQVLKETISYKDLLIKDYGLTEAQVVDVKQDLDNYRVMNGQPRTYKIASTQATKDLEQLFSQANELLTQKLDKVMKIFKRRDLNFYNGYLAARMVIDD